MDLLGEWPGDYNPDPPFLSAMTSADVPFKRSNLASYMAVNADARSSDYGLTRILQMSDTTQIDGPGQSFSAITTKETGGRPVTSLPEPGRSQRDLLQSAHPADGRRLALRDP